MKLIVTGAAGYLGSHLVRHFAQPGSHEVWGIDKAGVESSHLNGFLSGYLPVAANDGYAALRAFVGEVEPDAVLHVAALVRTTNEAEQVGELIESNIAFGTHLMQAVCDLGPRLFVNTGSFWESMDSSYGYRPQNLYAATKRALQDILRYYVDAFGLRAVTLQPFGIYGPNDHRPNVFSLFEQSLEAEEPIAFSPGRQRLDLIYIDDLVDAYQRALQFLGTQDGGVHETIEIGTGVTTALQDIAAIYEAARERPLNIAWGKRPYREREIFDRGADLKRARELLSWSPCTDLKTGVARCIACLGREV